MTREEGLARRAISVAIGLAVMLSHGMAAQQKVPVVLNHLMIVLDSATYHDVRNSPLMLGQFARADTGFLLGYEAGPGIRLMGKYNYLMLAAPSPSRGAQVGDAAIVLATTRAGDLARLTRQGEFREVGVISIQADGSPRPLEYTDNIRRSGPGGIDRLSERVELAFMEYSAEAARARAQVDSLPESNLAGSRFLAPFFDSQRLFVQLTGATLAFPVDDIAKIVRVLERDAVTVIPEGEGAIIKLDGFTLRLIPSFVGAGVKELQFALTRTALGNPIYQFGPKSQLRFGPGPIAVWSFKWP